MGRLLLVSLGLLSGIENLVLAQNTPAPAIQGPDGRGPVPLAPRPPQPSLEEQLQRRKKKRSDKPPAGFQLDTDQPATSTNELLNAEERTQIESLENETVRLATEALFRMSLSLAPAKAHRLSGSIHTWRFEPGTIIEGLWRVNESKDGFCIWTGLRLAAWNGSGQSQESFARFAALYTGPFLALVFRGVPQQSLSFGIAGVSRLADPNFSTENNSQVATRSLALDGSGMWIGYALNFHLIHGFDWQAQVGMQSGAAYLLSWVSLGVSLWKD